MSHGEWKADLQLTLAGSITSNRVSAWRFWKAVYKAVNEAGLGSAARSMLRSKWKDDRLVASRGKQSRALLVL
jgi:hypothetical protein